MNSKNKYKDKKNINKITIITTIFLFVILALTIGYSAFSDQLTITNIVSHIRVYKVVRINGVTTGSGAVSDLDYNTNSILNTVYIPAGGSVTYSVTATNLGNVPVAVSAVSFTNGNNPVNNLSSNVSTSNYIKICDNNVCTNGVSKTFDITITNNGSSTINTVLDVNLTFSEVYTISYEGNQLGEAIAGSNYTYTFPSNAPSKLAKISGTCDSFNYTSSTLTITNVGSDLNFTEAHTITYNGETQGYIADGGTYTYTFESQWPATVVKESGTSGTLTYQNHTITIPNVTSDIVLTGTIGKVEITRIQYISSKNVVNPTDPNNQPIFDGMNASFNVTFRKEEGSTDDEFEIIYEVDLSNTHYNDYIFRGFDFHPTITASADSDTATLTLTPVGVANGDVIASETTKTFRVVLTLTTNNPNGSYETGSTTQVDTTPDTEEETGTITATISPTTGDLRSPNTSAAFTLTVTSTYTSDHQFRLASSNSNLEIVNNNNQALGNLTIHGESTEQYTIYIKTIDGATFMQNTASMVLYLGVEAAQNEPVDTLTFDVDIYNVPDTTKVTVGNVQIAMHRNTASSAPTTGQIDVTWDRIDYGGSAISDYTVLLYNTSNPNTPAATGHTNSGTRTYSFTNVADGTYYVVVYGIDEAGNTGQNDVSSATTANGFASKSTNTSFEWRYNVTVTAQNLAVTGNGNDVALLEQSHTITVTASGTDGNNNNYIVADTVEVTMGGNTLTAGTNGDYTFKRSSNNTVGTITIKKVTGNITVTAARTTDNSGTCLIKGTKVLLANGEYKNIENINYDDLILVYSYETGKFVPEYPIWIEKGKMAKKYQKNTFSDGTVLKTYGYHGLYETELKRFVSVDNPNEFHIGSKIAKMKQNGLGFDEIVVTNIEYINEEVYYYQLASTRYFNFIANDLLTTDGIVEMSNIYGFNDNVLWNKSNREELLKDVFTYQELRDYLPYYMFKGLRAEEAKGLIKSGYNYNNFISFISLLTNDVNMLKPPIQSFGKNMWMVTTSMDNITDLNKHLYLRPEGSTYTLPSINNKDFLGWYNTADNKMYKSGDNITVYHGMYFEAIYK